MSDPGDIERGDGEHGGLSRRDHAAARHASPSRRLQLPVAASAQGVKPGAHLIGKLEGAEVVTDPAQVPKRFNGGAAARRAGQGGQAAAGRSSASARTRWSSSRSARSAATAGPGAAASRARSTLSNGHRVAQNDKLLYWDYTGTKLVPNIARGLGGRAATARSPRSSCAAGMKWSDGQPFTADDFVFWYEDVYQNKELDADAADR